MDYEYGTITDMGTEHWDYDSRTEAQIAADSFGWQLTKRILIPRTNHANDNR